MIVKEIKNTLVVGGVRLLIDKILLKVLRKFKRCFKKSQFTKLEFFLLNGYWPNLINPKSFTEKIVNRKIRNPHPLSTIVADKYSVRQFVKDRVGIDILIDIIWVGSDPEMIPFDDLPDSFIIKATHGSGWNIIINNKNKELNKEKVIEQCHDWLSTKWSTTFDELHYDNICPKIIIEELIQDDHYGIPLDYKFYCFNGKVHFIQVDLNRFSSHQLNFYDVNWNKQPFRVGFLPLGEWIAKPNLLTKMISIAEKLADDFDFCRIDLYCINDKKIYFGEVTLTPSAGHMRFKPAKYDFLIGKLWSLKKVN